MKCSLCKNKIIKSANPEANQCCDCYWLIAFTNGNALADKDHQMSRPEIFKRVLRICNDINIDEKGEIIK